MHKAIIVVVDKVEEIKGADNIQVAYVLGEAVIVSKDTCVGSEGVYFPEGLCLSQEYGYNNSIYRHSNLNKDTNSKGFFEDNLRVKAQKFMKVNSEGYFAPIQSLAFTGANLSKLKVGDQLDTLNKVVICKKWINPKTKAQGVAGNKRKTKLSTPIFHQHIDTEQFKYHIDKIPVGATLSFHHKLHGTSARYSHTLVERPVKGIKGWLSDILGNTIFSPTKAYEYVAGTRRVVLQQEHRLKVGYNGPEEWRFHWLDKLTPYLNKGVTVYGEIVGWANGSLIMGTHFTAPLKDKKYTKKYGETVNYKYGCPHGEDRLIVYRVSYTTAGGDEIDLSVDQLTHWCKSRGFEHTLEVAPRIVYDGNAEVLLEVVTALTEHPEVLTEDYTSPSQICEGIVIRVDHQGVIPKFYKNKSMSFRIMEGIYKEDNIDMEDAS